MLEETSGCRRWIRVPSITVCWLRFVRISLPLFICRYFFIIRIFTSSPAHRCALLHPTFLPLLILVVVSFCVSCMRSAVFFINIGLYPLIGFFDPVPESFHYGWSPRIVATVILSFDQMHYYLLSYKSIQDSISTSKWRTNFLFLL